MPVLYDQIFCYINNAFSGNDKHSNVCCLDCIVIIDGKDFAKERSWYPHAGFKGEIKFCLDGENWLMHRK